MTDPMQSGGIATDPDVGRIDRSIWSAQWLAPWWKARLPLGDGHEATQLICFVVVHVVVWSIVALIAHAPSDVHNDMAEAFSWGYQLQWGYYKHPPFWAWVARLWFSVFPTTDWAFVLLSAVSSAIGLVGVWAIAGRYVTGARRLAAVLLLELVPFHHFLAFNYNANSIQISLWPWAIYFFIVSYERRSLAASIGFGILAAAAVLSKYFGGVLLMSCFIAAVTNPRAGSYFRSYAPYISMFIFGICIAPHVVWSLSAVSGPLEYLATKTNYPFWFIVGKAVTVVGGIILLHCILVLVIFIVWRQKRQNPPGVLPLSLSPLLRRPRVRLLFVLATAPLFVTLLVSVLGHVRISTKFTLPLFTLVPLTWVILYRGELDGRSLRTIVNSVVFLMAASIALALPLAATKFKFNVRHFSEPRSIVAQRVTELWRLHIGAPLRIVAGTESYALATTFYSADHPSDFTGFSQLKAPWINDTRLRRDGLAIICDVSDETCLYQLEKFQARVSIRLTLNDVSKNFLGIAGRSFTFVLLLVRPGQTDHSSTVVCCRDISSTLPDGASIHGKSSQSEILL